MKKINYAIQIKDEFISFYWDNKMEWENLYKTEITQNNIGDILFEDYDEAIVRMSSLIEDLNEFNNVDDISVNDIPFMKVVKVELTFEYKIL